MNLLSTVGTVRWRARRAGRATPVRCTVAVRWGNASPRAHSAPYGVVHRPKRRSRSELATTLTLENAIAAPATIGDRNPSAAMGMASVL